MAVGKAMQRDTITYMAPGKYNDDGYSYEDQNKDGNEIYSPKVNM